MVRNHMVRHVVMWKLKDTGKAEELRKIILDMKGKVPSLIDVEYGVNFAEGDAACDLVLISTHESRAELDIYQDDPVHGEVKKILGAATASRSVADFEVD